MRFFLLLRHERGFIRWPAVLAAVMLFLVIGGMGNGCGSKSKLQLTESVQELSSGTSVMCVDPNSPGSPTSVRPLSKREISNSLRDILGNTIYSAISESVLLLPNDEKGIKFDHIANKISDLHVESYFSLAEKVAQTIVGSYSTFYKVGSCWSVADDRACISTFINDFGYRLFRRPLKSEETSLYLSVYDILRSTSKSEATELVIASMLQSPNFYYISEINGTPAGGNNILKLSSYELATRISFALTGSTPDDTLLEAAKSGSLNSSQGIDTQVERLFKTTKARNHFKEYADQYLGLYGLPDLNYSAAFQGNQSLSGLADQMVSEAQSYMLHHFLDSNSTFSDLMTANFSFVKNNQLAQLYGVTASSTDPVMMPEERHGLLTKAALLVNSGDEHNPFHRGNIVASEFLCVKTGRPDPDAVPDAFAPIENIHEYSTRDAYEKITQSNTCMVCHSTLNSFGFAFENFDALGRFRTSEVKYDENGDVYKTFSVNANVAPVIDGRSVPVASARDLGRAIASSTQAQQCFARKWVRFSLGKIEHGERDGCYIDELSKIAATKDLGILGMLKQAIKHKQFGLRVIPNS